MKKEMDAIKQVLFDSSRSTADHAVEMLLAKPSLLSTFASLSFSDEYPFDMRSSNVIEKADEIQPGFAAALVPEVVGKLILFKNDGPRRQFLRMMSRYVHRMDEEHTGILYDACYSFVCDTGQPVAVRHNSAMVLGELGKRYPELWSDIRLALRLRINEEHGPFRRWILEFLESEEKK